MKTMKTKYICIFYVVICGFLGSAQEWNWGNHFNFEGTEGKSIIGGFDKEGNVYLTVSTSSSSHQNPWIQYWLLKVDNEGNLVWKKNIDNYSYGSIVTDIDGNTYIAWFNQIIKFNSDGVVMWIVNETLQKNFYSIFLAATGGVLVSGGEKGLDSTRYFISRFGPNGTALSSACIPKASRISYNSGNSLYLAKEGYADPQTGNQGYLSKYDLNGTCLFQKSIPHTPSILLTDKKENVYVYGWHEIFPIYINNVQYKTPGHFLIKYDPSGNLLWYKIITGMPAANSIDLDSEDNLYYAVDYSAEIKINEYELKGGAGGLLLVKFDPNGNIIWTIMTPSSNTGAYGYVYPSQLALDKENGIFISGPITGTLQFGSSLVQTSSDMYSELFVGRIDQTKMVDLKMNGSQENDLLIFPNPSGDRFYLSLPATEGPAAISVTDVTGRLIIDKTLEKIEGSQCEIDLSAQPKGVYFLRVTSGEKSTVKKLVRN
jgi:hypothetical protein